MNERKLERKRKYVIGCIMRLCEDTNKRKTFMQKYGVSVHYPLYDLQNVEIELNSKTSEELKEYRMNVRKVHHTVMHIQLMECDRDGCVGYWDCIGWGQLLKLLWDDMIEAISNLKNITHDRVVPNEIK
ncbi:hypothetical protein GCK72_008954 [Caenorhabditis remanei]|uniref:Uncharacterized protein n=1 Tax=Caenorhabditis remanei TaxID=31234 RepID=A0A6A5H1B9_CAERE|nr:hypothetical protein GCK72_008954 [Caenorhabditis remanei]KAF1760705.1 hypothetical protein GCK72_008954 [Caenorhabditis remanei]